MKKLKKTIEVKGAVKILSIIFLLVILWVLNANNYYEMMSFVLILASASLLIKVKDDIKLFLVAIPIFYANYSIAIGEFLNKNTQISFNSIRFLNYDMYVTTLLAITAFTIIFTSILKPNSRSNEFPFKDNPVIFYVLLVMSILINYLFFDRSDSSGYIVRTNSIHGYLYILFLFMTYYSGDKKHRKILIVSSLAFVVIQSLIFGGRLAVIPSVVIVVLTLFPNRVNYKNITPMILLGVIVLTTIGQIRGTGHVDVRTILELFKEGFFVQDTSVYAFNSSVTHVYSREIYSLPEKMLSLVAFVVSIVIGQGSEFTNFGNVTLVSDNVMNNLGGGIIGTHFYFWLGWIGVVLSAILFSMIINHLNHSEQHLHLLALIAIVATTSTWYIYSPLQFFRILFVFVPLIYFFMYLVNKELKRLRRRT